MDEKITLEDILPYQRYVSKVPAFALKRMARRKSNLVSKFESQIKSRLGNMSHHQRHLLNIALNSEVSDLQNLMGEAFKKTGKKQFKILADSKNAEFIRKNLDELEKTALKTNFHKGISDLIGSLCDTSIMRRMTELYILQYLSNP